MKRPKQPKLPARIARWAQRDRVFAALICRNSGVGERLDAVERFRNAKAGLPSAQARRPWAIHDRRCTPGRRWTTAPPASLANGSRRGVSHLVTGQ